MRPTPFPLSPERREEFRRKQEELWKQPRPTTVRRQSFVERETIHLARYCENEMCKYNAYLNFDVMRNEIGRWLQETYNRWRPTVDYNNQEEVDAAVAMYTHLEAAATRGTSLDPVVDAFNEWCDVVKKPITVTIMKNVPLMEDLKYPVGVSRKVFIAEAGDEEGTLTDDPEAYNTHRGAEMALIDAIDGWIRDLSEEIRKCDNQGAHSSFRNLAVGLGKDDIRQVLGSWKSIIERCPNIEEKYYVQLYEAELKG